MKRGYYLALALSLLFFLSGIFFGARASELVNMEFKEAPLVDVFRLLGGIGGYNVLVDPSVSGQVSFVLKDLPVQVALDLVTKTTGYHYELLGNTLVVGSPQRLKEAFGSQDFVFISVKHVSVLEAQKLISLVTPAVKSYLDTERGLLVLFGFTTDLELAQRVLVQYDQKTTAESFPQSDPAALELPRHTVPIFHGEGPRILELVQKRWPQRDFSYDPQSGILQGRTTDPEWLDVLALVREEDLPHFVLKGLLKSGALTWALVEYAGATEFLQVGETLHGWELVAIEEREVQFQLDEQKFSVSMGR